MAGSHRFSMRLGAASLDEPALIIPIKSGVNVSSGGRLGPSNRQATNNTQHVSCLRSYSGFRLQFITTRITQFTTKMKGAVQKAKAKVDRLFDNLGRKGSRPRSPAPRDTDLELAPPIPLSSGIIREPPNLALPAATNESTAFPRLAQVVVTPYPVPRDPAPITPTSLSDPHFSRQSKEAVAIASFTAARMSPNLSQGAVSVRMTISERCSRPESFQSTSNNNWNTTYNYGRDVFNNNPVTYNIHTSKEEVWLSFHSSSVYTHAL